MTELELTWDLREAPISIENFVSRHQEVSVLVTAVEGKKFSASLKRLNGNPWLNPPEIGDTFDGTIRMVTEYGYFVFLTPELEGLLLRESAKSEFAKGQAIYVRVALCDPDRERIMLEPATKDSSSDQDSIVAT
ncbi:MAG: S1 RNA-binding domain-containing protein [Pseudomonadota bacterium]